MRFAPVGILLSFLLNTATFAQENQAQSFPYEAIVQGQGEDVYVRSGPSRKYYPTGKLQAGDRVTVHRHDPGGWYMVAPPPGSFSWIPARYVEQAGNQTGTVTENNVVIRVGSFQSDIRDVVQRRLSQGDTVQILGEKLLESEKGQERWYQIAPPAAEYRWIMGQHVTPVGQTPIGRNVAQNTAEAMPKSPFAEGSVATAQPGSSANAEDPFAAKPVTATKGTAIARTGPPAAEIAAAREHLEMLDQQLREILKASADQWRFDDLEASYELFQQQVPVPALQSQVDLRLASIDEYRFIQQDYLEFIELTKKTNQRDSQLLSIQGSQRPAATSVSVSPSGPPQSDLLENPTPVPDPVSVGPQAPANVPVTTGPQAPPPRSSAPRSVTPNPTAPNPASPQPGPQPAAPRRPFQFDGAGIVQRLPNTGPGGLNHVLVAPNGRILAFLRPPPDLDLDRYAGHAMGISGPRVYDANLRADLLTVERMTPIRLAQ